MANKESIASILKRNKVDEKTFDTFVNKLFSQWINGKGQKHIEHIINIIKEYAEDVDVGAEFREEWNRTHAEWDRYKDKPVKKNKKFASTVTYRIDGNTIYIRNDAEAQPPMWSGSYPKKGDLSDWIEGDEETGDSCIHPIPPYWNVNGKKIFKAWFEKSEWLKMWYKANPYMKNALNDNRLEKIREDSLNDFYEELETAIRRRWK